MDLANQDSLSAYLPDGLRSTIIDELIEIATPRIVEGLRSPRNPILYEWTGIVPKGRR